LFNQIKWLLNLLKRQKTVAKPPARTPTLRQPLMKPGDQAKHADISKFFRGKGQKPHLTYRRMVKERKKPEDTQ